MSYLSDLQQQAKEKKAPKPKPKAPSRPDPVVTHVYPVSGEMTVPVKKLLDIQLSDTEIWSEITHGTDLHNWLTRSKGTDKPIRTAALARIREAVNAALRKKLHALL
jgi:hypothetical protein